jgi:hypothetical protein
MAYRIAGRYVLSCSCAQLCGCPADQLPNNPKGECRAVAVMVVANGYLDDIDLSGVKFAYYNFYPSRISEGNWKVGLVIDEQASSEQARALERIVRGQEGGLFEQIGRLIGDFAGVERASIAISDGDETSASVSGGRAEFLFRPFRGEDGGPTTVKNAMFAFAPEFRIGSAPGRGYAFDIQVEGSYGEAAEFVFTHETDDGIQQRA